MIRFDPMALARTQLARDHHATRRFPELFERKIARMKASPFAFLRGAAPLFYDLLLHRRSLSEGPRGSGHIVGDLHLENFGAYRPVDPAFEKRGGEALTRIAATFGLNDFDDATIGPWRFDLLRLTTSLILAAREMGASGTEALHMSDSLLDAWNEHAHPKGRRRAVALPRPVAELVNQVAMRTRKQLLDARTEIVGGRRRFMRGPRYRDLPADLRKQVPAAFTRYVASLEESERPDPERLEIVDAAFRIAGTGSLGALRIAVLVAGKGGVDGGWIFDMKEQGAPSSHALCTPPKRNGAKRVRLALSGSLAEPPRMVGVTRLDGVPMLVRRLNPQDDKLDISRLDHEDLEPLAHYLGCLVGEAHCRGATDPGRVWKPRERAELIEKAIALAGVHEAVYLAYCNLTRR